MHKSFVGVLASAALVGSAVLVPSAHAAVKTITIWADDQRGPALKKIIDGNTTIAKGYIVKVSTYANYDALDGAWQKATAASGPDIMFNPVGDAVRYGKSGKVLPLFLSSHAKDVFSSTALKYGQYQGKQYGLPLDIDTTSMYWNTKFGPAPKTFAELAADFQKAKAAGTATVGFCAGDGTWGALPFLTALGGGAWGTKANGTPDITKNYFNTKALASNIATYALGSDGKSNGLFNWDGWDGCGQAWINGKALAINTGAWRLQATKDAKINFTIQPTPTLDGTGLTHQWAGFGGAWLSTFANDHQVSVGARKVLAWFASEEGALAYANATGRPSPNTAITSSLSDDVRGFAESGAKNGSVQVDALLGDATGGSNWYDVLTATFTDIFNNGKPVQATLDKGAKILAGDWADGITKL